jgi:alpha-D-xyloside xylohydrolase
MFGKSILVAPVTEPGTNLLNVYLPKSASWFNFYTNKKYAGGQNTTVEAPLDQIPLFVKAGSILPVGSEIQYATEKKWDDLEIQIYEGANGDFTLYEDETDNYNYEKGIYSTINFKWNDKSKTLTIANRKGTFPGMLTERKFRIIKISNKDTHQKTEKEVVYKGNKVLIQL